MHIHVEESRQMTLAILSAALMKYRTIEWYFTIYG